MQENTKKNLTSKTFYRDAVGRPRYHITVLQLCHTTKPVRHS